MKKLYYTISMSTDFSTKSARVYEIADDVPSILTNVHGIRIDDNAENRIREHLVAKGLDDGKSLLVIL